MFKKLVVFLFVIICFTFVEASSLSIYVNQRPIDLSEQIILNQGVTKVSVRAISNIFNAKISWDNKTKKISIEHLDNEVSFKANKKKFFINNRLVLLNQPIELLDGVTYVPLRLIAKAFDCKIDFNNMQKRIDIEKNNRIQTASPIAYDRLQNQIYMYSQGNDFESEISIERKLTIMDEDTGEIIKRVNDLSSEENTLTIYKNNLYQYRFIRPKQCFGITKQSLSDLKNVEVFNLTTNKRSKDIKIIGAVNDYLYFTNSKEICRINLQNDELETIYKGEVRDVHLRRSDLIFIDNKKIIKADLNGKNVDVLEDGLDCIYSKGAKNYQLRVTNDKVYFINKDHIISIDISNDKKARVVNNYKDYFNLISHSSFEGLGEELITNFLPTESDIYLSKVEETFIEPKKHFINEDYIKFSNKMELDEFKSFKKWFRLRNSKLFSLKNFEDEIVVNKSYGYKFGSDGSVFPNFNYLFKLNSYIYIEKKYQGNMTYYRYNIKTKTLKPLAYNIKHFTYEN